MKKSRIIILLAIILCVLNYTNVYAGEKDFENELDSEIDTLNEEIDYTKIEEVLDNYLDKNDESFAERVKRVATKSDTGITDILSDVFKEFGSELAKRKSMLAQIILIAIIAAVFTSFSRSFSGSQVAETGFSIVYMLLFVVLMSSFQAVSGIIVQTLEGVLDFTKVLAPVYTLTVMVGKGYGTGMLYYNTVLIIIGLLQWGILEIMLPMINVYAVLVLADNVVKEEMISKLAELLKNIIKWTNRSCLIAITGIQAIQKLITAPVDDIKKSTLINVSGAIPVIGNSFKLVNETVIGAGVVIKNAVGVSAIVIILTLCLVPLASITVYLLAYNLSAVCIQPVADKRIIGCIMGMVNGCKLLLEIVFSAMVLFILSIAIAAGS